MRSIAQKAKPRRHGDSIPELQEGDRLGQEEFHRRYEATPEHVKAELIGGVVYMPSPLGLDHGRSDSELNGVFWLFKGHTPGTEVMANTTTILGPSSEPQPDHGLRVLAEYGGLSQTSKDHYVLGPPEVLAETAHTSLAIDLGPKKEDYRNAGVLEYIVVNLQNQEVHWFELKNGTTIEADADGIMRSRVFPGLWIDKAALLARDSAQLMKTALKGVASPEHKRFVQELLSRKNSQ